MKLYRVTWLAPDGIELGRGWYAERSRAEAVVRESSSDEVVRVDEFDLPLRRDQVVVFLNKHASHPDNG